MIASQYEIKLREERKELIRDFYKDYSWYEDTEELMEDLTERIREIDNILGEDSGI